jgi:hypothetical protein
MKELSKKAAAASKKGVKKSKSEHNTSAEGYGDVIMTNKLMDENTNNTLSCG